METIGNPKLNMKYERQTQSLTPLNPRPKILGSFQLYDAPRGWPLSPALQIWKQQSTERHACPKSSAQVFSCFPLNCAGIQTLNPYINQKPYSKPP